ncbi:glutaredoxin family protein [Pseudomonas sp. Gutcm_11s]|uniref:glutaredoxin family protein n=1 Tax=Pseudomonas sp. Gutcm_11s TaxID=3026088 RepID=UPI0023602828|nr:glutaredoxin family protein [Pseudomonas sp. Gutcm_11s]MDD0841535.1 glutaredoxin family protein [Pseudomonas sp. Gutcm_11s]
MGKRIFVLLAALAAWQNWERIETFTGLKPTPQEVAASTPVVLYATAWCGYCAKTRSFLAEQGIPYTEFDIEKSSEGRRAYDALGGRGFPLMTIGDTVLRGYNPEGIKAALR